MRSADRKNGRARCHRVRKTATGYAGILPAEEIDKDKNPLNLRTTKITAQLTNTQKKHQRSCKAAFDVLKTNNIYKNGVKYTGTQTVCPSLA